MRVEISKDGVKVFQPNIQKTEDGRLKALGSCWVKGDELGCYGWQNEEMLLILDKIPADSNDIPCDQYFCLNTYNQETGWVLDHQVTFELESCFGEPYRLKKV